MGVKMIDDNYFSNDMQLNVGYRYEHACPTGAGRDRPLVVTRITTGWKWYCHRCHEKGIKFAKGLSPTEWLRFNQAREVRANNVVSKVRFPHGCVDEIPAIGLAWLYKYGLTDLDIDRFNICYSNTLNRVVLPVYDSMGELVYYQARNLGEVTEKSPKYMNVKARGRKNIYFVVDQFGNGDRVVVVEDILSAIRVGNHECCYGLLNAYIPDDLILFLSKTYPEIVLWLDPDKINRMTDRVKRYRSFGINVRMIRASQDPKYYTDDEIAKKLEV
jgi:DNA primase